MTAIDHIIEIPTLVESSKRKDCIDLMVRENCFDLPVFKGDRLFGTITLKACVDSKDNTIEKLILPGFASAYFQTHIMDLLAVYNETPFDSIAVLGEHLEFIGVITKRSLLAGFSHSLSMEQGGAVILVEMATHQYSSSEICRIIEGENAQLLGLVLHNVPDSGRIRASLKINTKNAERIINSLMRFNYEVIATFGDDDYKENVEKRYQALMKYLDI